MHYAVISTGGKQYMASLGQSLIIESLPQAAGELVVFENVLLVVDGSNVQVGQPHLDGLTVSATIVEQRLGEKLRVFKYRPKSRYSRTRGHRQHQTVVMIDAIGDKKVQPVKKAPEKDQAEIASTATKPARKVSTKKAKE